MPVLILVVGRNLLAAIYTVDDIEPRSVVPIHHDTAGIVDTNDSATCANWRGLCVVHLDKFYTGASRIKAAQMLMYKTNLGVILM